MSARGTTARTEKIAKRVAIVYRVFFLYVEPLSALIGAYYAYFQPQTYLDLTHHPSSPQPGNIPTSTQIILTQLANLYLLFAINEALILRSTTDLKIWRKVLLCLLLADFGHLYSVGALGVRIYWDAVNWNAIDWGNVGFVYAGAFMRTLFLSGFGISTPLQARTNGRLTSRAKS